jgi:hypothetical protein
MLPAHPVLSMTLAGKVRSHTFRQTALVVVSRCPEERRELGV